MDDFAGTADRADGTMSCTSVLGAGWPKIIGNPVLS